MTTSIKVARDYLNGDDTDNIDLSVKRIANELLDELEGYRYFNTENPLADWLDKFEATCGYEVDAKRMYDDGMLDLPAFQRIIERHRKTGEFDVGVAIWVKANGGPADGAEENEPADEPELPTGGKPGQVRMSDGEGNFKWVDPPKSDAEKVQDSIKEARATRQETELREAALDAALRMNGIGFGSSAGNLVASAGIILAFLKGESA